MHMVRSSWFTVAAMTLLCACGAGGDEFSVRFSTSEFAARALQGIPGFDSPVAIRAVGGGPRPDALYVGATVHGMGIATPLSVTLDPVGESATITVAPDTSVPVGTYAGTLTLLACKDAACEENFPGSPHQVAYRIEIVDRLGTSPSAVTLQAAETTVTAAVPLTTTFAATATVTYEDGGHWLQVTAEGSTVTLQADASALHAGTYRATLSLRSEEAGQTLAVPVTFLVTPALTGAEGTTVTLTSASVPADSRGEFVVGAAAGIPVPGWTAVSDVDWLVVDRPAGAVGESVTWHLYPPAVSALPSFTTQTGHITVTAGSLTPVTAAIELIKQLPEIKNVDRLALLPDQPGTVMVYGTGLQTIANPRTDLRIDGVAPTAVTVLSDRALAVAVPALPAGEYAVTLDNALGIVGASKPLSVLAPVDRIHQEIATEGGKLSLAWDAITQSAYVINASLDLVMRFDLSHTPATVTGQSIPGALALGLPLDRSVLVVGDGAGNLLDLDPFDLSPIRTRAAGANLHASEAPIPITGENLAWISSYNGLAYDLDRSAPATWADPGHQFACYFCAMSPDGRRMVFNQDPTVFPGPPLAYWDGVEGALHPYVTESVGVFYLASSDHTGDRWILDFGRVFDFNLASQGTIDTPQGWLGIRYAMSRNGRRAYVYAIADGAIGTYEEPDPHVFPKIFVFDTTGPLITTTSYPLLGSFDVAAYGSCLATQGPVACSPYSLSFAMTDDEHTLLAVGDRRFLVIPIPAQFQSP